MGGISEAALKRKDLFLVHPDQIKEDEGFNLRRPRQELTDHIRRFADIAKERGTDEIPPLDVFMRGNDPVVYGGHCRLAGIRLAIAEGAPVKGVWVQAHSAPGSRTPISEVDRTLAMLNGNSQLALTSLEISDGIKRLMAFNWSREEVAKQTGYSVSQISNFIKLSTLGPELTTPVEKGQVSATMVIEEVRSRGQAGAVSAISEGIATAEGRGKKKATKKDMPRKPKVEKLPLKGKVEWEKWGPIFLKAVEDICNASNTSWSARLTTAREILASFKEAG